MTSVNAKKYMCDPSVNTFMLCLEIYCPKSIPNGRLPYNCNAIDNGSCYNYTCGRGYERNETIGALTCTDLANWNHNESSLCLGMCIYEMVL